MFAVGTCRILNPLKTTLADIVPRRDGKPRYLADAPRFIGYIRATAGRYRELTPLLRLVDQIEGIHTTSGYAYGRVA